MNDSAKTTLLERLRAQSAAALAADTAARQPLESARKETSRRLRLCAQWLDEAVGYLGVIRPQVKRRFRLLSTVTFDDPRFDQGYVAFRRRGLDDADILDHVELQYRLVAEAPVVARVGIGAARHLEERLRTSLLKFDYESEQDDSRVVRHGVFRVEPTISASVRFRPDYSREVVNVTLHNVDRFESLQLDFATEALGEPALEDLVRCILGESDRFLHLAPVALAGRRANASSVARDVRHGTPAADSTAAPRSVTPSASERDRDAAQPAPHDPHRRER